MNLDSFDLNLPTGPGLPPPPPMDRDAMFTHNLMLIADFYRSPHFEAWLERTSEEMRHAEPFVM